MGKDRSEWSEVIATIIGRFESFVGSILGLSTGKSGGYGETENTTRTYSYPTTTGEIQVTEQERDNVFYEQQTASGRATGKMESPQIMKDAIKDFYKDLEKEKVIEPRLTDEDDETLG